MTSQNESPWVSTKEKLPNIGERVLIIEKWGHVTDASLVAYDPKEPPLFRPDGLRPDVDVKWWMPYPDDDWRGLKYEQPKEGQVALTMNQFGHVFSGVWKRTMGAESPEFVPFVWAPVFWREMPPLPDGVKLNH